MRSSRKRCLNREVRRAAVVGAIVGLAAGAGVMGLRPHFWPTAPSDLSRAEGSTARLMDSIGDLISPGNAVIETDAVAEARDAFWKSKARYNVYRVALDDAVRSGPSQGAAGFPRDLASLERLDGAVAALCRHAEGAYAAIEQRKALRVAGASPERIREQARAAETAIARMNQNFLLAMAAARRTGNELVRWEMSSRMQDAQANRRGIAGAAVVSVVMIAIAWPLATSQRRLRRRLRALRTAQHETALQASRRSADRTEHEAWTHALVATVADGVLTIDEHGVILSLNPAAQRIFGYAADRVVHRHVTMLFALPGPHQDGSTIDQMLRASSDKSAVGVRRLRGRSKDGVLFPIDLSVTATTRDGRRLAIAIVRDLRDHRPCDRAIDNVIPAPQRTSVAQEFPSPPPGRTVLHAPSFDEGVRLAEEPDDMGQEVSRVLRNAGVRAARANDRPGTGDRSLAAREASTHPEATRQNS